MLTAAREGEEASAFVERQDRKPAPVLLVETCKVALRELGYVYDFEGNISVVERLDGRGDDVVARGDGEHLRAAGRAFRGQDGKRIHRGRLHRKVDHVLDAPAHRVLRFGRRNVGGVDLQHLVVAAAQQRRAAIALCLKVAAQSGERRPVIAFLAKRIAQQHLGPRPAPDQHMRHVDPLRVHVDAQPPRPDRARCEEPHS
jgi:hypothetical protein